MSYPQEFICPISREVMIDPVTCEDGHTYERSEILKIKNGISPLTRKKISLNKLVTNYTIKSLIQNYKTNIAKKSRETENLIKQKEKQRKYIESKAYLYQRQQLTDDTYSKYIVEKIIKINILSKNAIKIKKKRVKLAKILIFILEMV